MAPLALYYIRWHYTYALHDFVGIGENFLWFLYHFFSLPTLTRTLFVPFYRLSEKPHKNIVADPEAWAEALVVNTMMRLIGALMRTSLILTGVVVLCVSALTTLLLFVAWVLAPLLLFFLIASGVSLILAA